MSKQESRVRSLARRMGYMVQKSRKQIPDFNNQGEYALLDGDNGWVVLGSRFDASLDEIEHWLRT